MCIFTADFLKQNRGFHLLLNNMRHNSRKPFVTQKQILFALQIIYKSHNSFVWYQCSLFHKRCSLWTFSYFKREISSFTIWITATSDRKNISKQKCFQMGILSSMQYKLINTNIDSDWGRTIKFLPAFLNLNIPSVVIPGVQFFSCLHDLIGQTWYLPFSHLFNLLC